MYIMDIKLKKGSKNISVKVKKLSFWGRFTGLMFRSKSTQNLLFEFNGATKQPIHSFFVFFDFLAIWLDSKNKVLEYKIVKPFLPSIKPAKKFSKLVEIPLNTANKKILNLFVGKGKI